MNKRNVIIISLILALLVCFAFWKQASSKEETPVVKEEKVFEYWNEDSEALKKLI